MRFRPAIFAASTDSAMREYLFSFLRLSGAMAPYLLSGFLVAGLLHAFVPRRFYVRCLSGDGWSSVAAAALLGVPLPLCSCGVIPTAMSMYRRGASRAATVSFLIATPQTGVDSILATGALLGVPFALLRPLAALVTALAGGWLTGRVLPGTAPEAAVSGEDAAVRRSLAAKCREALRYGFVDMIRDIGRWLVVGLLLAGAITVLLPEGAFALFDERPLAGMLFVLLLSAPMYLCATGSIPVAAALMLKGLSPGAALVLLMAGPATNMAAMLVIGKVLGSRTLWLYLGSIAAGAVGFGLLIDGLLPASWFLSAGGGSAAACCTDAPMAWWQVASALLLLVLLVAAFVLKKTRTDKIHIMESNFRIEGMMCNHCKAAVERGIAAVAGVDSVEVDLARGIARVAGNVDASAVVAAVERLGYECAEE